MHGDALALGYVGSRIIESTIIGVGAISLLSILTLREDLAASIRRRRRVARHRRPDPRRDPRLDVPARTRILRWHQRPPAGLPDVSLGAHAAPVCDAERRPIGPSSHPSSEKGTNDLRNASQAR